MSKSYIEELNAYLEQTHPSKSGIWNYSINNTLSTDWLFATPTNTWDTLYQNFKMAVKGDYPDFGLAPCTRAAPDSTQRCAPLQATVKKPGDTPAKLLVGHSANLVDAVYNQMISANTFLDFTSLTAPTGRFLAAFRNAITTISNKPENQRPIIRILYSNLPPFYSTIAVDFLKEIIRDVDKTSKMELYVGVVSSTLHSWNHAKIIAADGASAMVGGHNLWGPHYLETNPAFDVTMIAEGTAAIHAHDFIDFMWRFIINSLEGKSYWFTTDYIRGNNIASYTFDPSKGENVLKDGANIAIDLYTKAKAHFAPTTPGNIPILAVGRKANMGSSAFLPNDESYLYTAEEPSDLAMLKLFSLAQSSIQMSLQTLASDGELLWHDFYWYLGWNYDAFIELAQAILRGVNVHIVISNRDALAGPEKELYQGDLPEEINQHLLSMMVNELGQTELQAKSKINEHFKVASLRFSKTDAYNNDNDKNEDENGIPIPNHAKTFFVDEQIFYIGSQNQYRCNLNEFGYIVEDPTIAKSYASQYWNPLWVQSKRTVVQTFSEELLKKEEAGGLLFILELRRNKRLDNTWTDTIKELQNMGSPKEIAETAKILNDIILNAGFTSSSDAVLRTLNTPFFTKNANQLIANNDAKRFVIQILKDRNLLQSFASLINKQTGTPEESEQNITLFLHKKGYQCSALQVLAASDDLRNDTLAYWTGKFDTWIRPDGGTSYTDFAPHPDDDDTAQRRVQRRRLSARPTTDIKTVAGPALTVLSNTQAKLGDDEIKNLDFRNGILSWNMASGNTTSGSLVLSQISQPGLNDPFVGFEFFGTLSYPNDGKAPQKGPFSCYGRWSQKDNVDDPNSPIPFPWPVGILIGLAAMLGIGGSVVYKRRRDRLEQERNAILNHPADFEPISGNRNTKWEQLNDRLANRQITADEFKRSLKEMNQRIDRQSKEWLEMTSFETPSSWANGLQEVKHRNTSSFQDNLEQNSSLVQKASTEVAWEFLRTSLEQKVDQEVREQLSFERAPFSRGTSELTEQLSRDLRFISQDTLTPLVESQLIGQLKGMNELTARTLIGSEVIRPKVREMLAESGGTSYFRESITGAVLKAESHFLTEHASEIQKSIVEKTSSIQKTTQELGSTQEQLDKIEEQLKNDPDNSKAPDWKKEQEQLNKEIERLTEEKEREQKEKQEAEQAQQEQQGREQENEKESQEAQREREARGREIFNGE